VVTVDDVVAGLEVEEGVHGSAGPYASESASSLVAVEEFVVWDGGEMGVVFGWIPDEASAECGDDRFDVDRVFDLVVEEFGEALFLGFVVTEDDDWAVPGEVGQFGDGLFGIL